MDALQTLLEIEDIKKLKARYFRFVDTFDLENWLTVFTEDCQCLYDGAVPRAGAPAVEPYRVEGKRGITEYWRANTNRLQSVHHGHMPEIDLISDTEARGIWAMEDIVQFTDALMHGYGHYHETYRKVDGKWLIASLHLTRVRISQTYLGRVGP
jgi:hypothetical protein